MTTLKYLALSFFLVTGISWLPNASTPSAGSGSPGMGWSGSEFHPGILPCGCDTLDLVDSLGQTKDAKGNAFGYVQLCNDSAKAYVQIYLGRGRQMDQILLWSGKVGTLPATRSAVNRASYLKFSAGFRNSYTLQTPLTTTFSTEDISLILKSVELDGFPQQVVDRRELFLKAKPIGGATVYTRTVFDCCPPPTYPQINGTAYHYMPPVACDTILKTDLATDKGEKYGSFQLYSTEDSLVFVFDLDRGYLLGNTYIWVGDKTPPLVNPTTPDINRYPIKKRPWRQNWVFTLPIKMASGSCKKVQVYTEAHEINMLSQSVGFKLTHPSGFKITGKQWCAPVCCFRPETL